MARSVSVLLKTSRGLKQYANIPRQHGHQRFSALEDEPWIEARRIQRVRPLVFGFSALEDEPWIEARQHTRLRVQKQRFSALEDEPWIEANPSE